MGYNTKAYHPGQQVAALEQEINQDRADLFDLDIKPTYIVSGLFAEEHKTNSDRNTRITITEVTIYPYDVNTKLEDLPVIGRAGHLNLIRTKENMEYVKLKPGLRTYWLGNIQHYNYKGIPRITFKSQRSCNIKDEIELIEKRLRNLNSLYESLSEDDIATRVNKTSKLLLRIKDIIETFQFIPYITKDELVERATKCIQEQAMITQRPKMVSYEPTDTAPE
nr:hypothetical protein 18 [bacterium]